MPDCHPLLSEPIRKESSSQVQLRPPKIYTTAPSFSCHATTALYRLVRLRQMLDLEWWVDGANNRICRYLALPSSVYRILSAVAPNERALDQGLSFFSWAGSLYVYHALVTEEPKYSGSPEVRPTEILAGSVFVASSVASPAKVYRYLVSANLLCYNQTYQFCRDLRNEVYWHASTALSSSPIQG